MESVALPERPVLLARAAPRALPGKPDIVEQLALPVQLVLQDQQELLVLPVLVQPVQLVLLELLE